MCALKGKDYALNMVRNIYRLKLIKMIETRQSVNTNVTPKTITTSMIDTDLKDGLNKRDMMDKYNIRKWEIDRIFKNPKLTGRRPSPKLSFTFVDDMNEDTEVDPNQITLEDAIDEAIEGVKEVKNQMQDTQDAIIDMLSPTQFETPEETVAKVNGPIDEDDELEIPTLSDTMELVEEQEMEAGTEEEVVEIEEGDEFDSFEL